MLYRLALSPFAVSTSLGCFRQHDRRIIMTGESLYQSRFQKSFNFNNFRLVRNLSETRGAL